MDASDLQPKIDRIATLESELDSERTRRIAAEDQLTRLREETSAGPFDANASKELDEARAQIEHLSNELGRERSERDELERRYAELKVRLEEQPVAVAPVPV